jgi:hypothetical protein
MVHRLHICLGIGHLTMFHGACTRMQEEKFSLDQLDTKSVHTASQFMNVLGLDGCGHYRTLRIPGETSGLTRYHD